MQTIIRTIFFMAIIFTTKLFQSLLAKTLLSQSIQSRQAIISFWWRMAWVFTLATILLK